MRTDYLMKKMLPFTMTNDGPPFFFIDITS